MYHVIETAEWSEDDAKSCNAAEGRGRRPSPVAKPDDFAEDERCDDNLYSQCHYVINELGPGEHDNGTNETNDITCMLCAPVCVNLSFLLLELSTTRVCVAPAMRGALEW